MIVMITDFFVGMRNNPPFEVVGLISELIAIITAVFFLVRYLHKRFKPKKSIKKQIYHNSKKELEASRKKGNRFSGLNVVHSLLPEAYIKLDKGSVEASSAESKESVSVFSLLEKHKDKHISISGEGGMGKTTLLFELLQHYFDNRKNLLRRLCLYLSKEHNEPVPIFIELSKANQHIGDYYSSETRKSDFVLRYIAAQNSKLQFAQISPKTISLLEDEFKKEVDTPNYLFLLDGINEVSNELSVDGDGKKISRSAREILFNEVRSLMSYPNVRIITASRRTDLSSFEHKDNLNDVYPIELKGVSPTEIRKHLSENGYTDISIGFIMHSSRLRECLRVPLFLVLFTSKHKETDNLQMPTARGEILYSVFNQKDSQYVKALQRVIDSTGNKNEYMAAQFSMDFILPYIGWVMELDNQFTLTENEMLEHIRHFLNYRNDSMDETTVWNLDIYVFPDYQDSIGGLSAAADTAKSLGEKKILHLISEVLVILYRNSQGNYSFIHHHIRDYFASFHIVQHLRMAAAYYDRYDQTKKRIDAQKGIEALQTTWAHMWNDIKVSYVGEILSEHRYTPQLENGNWRVPDGVFFEKQNVLVLNKVLKLTTVVDADGPYAVQNIVEVMKASRKSLAGIDFSNLDLSNARLHGVNCSLYTDQGSLTSVFKNTTISLHTLVNEGHTENLIQFHYSSTNSFLFTYAEDDMIKKWHVETGRCIETIEKEDFSPIEAESYVDVFFAPSDDSFIMEGTSESDELCIKHYFWGFEESPRFIYLPHESYNSIHVMDIATYGTDTLVVYDRNHLHFYRNYQEAVTVFQQEIEPLYYIHLSSIHHILSSHILDETMVLLYYLETWIDDHTPSYSISHLNMQTKSLTLLHSYNCSIDGEDDDAVEDSYSLLFTVSDDRKNFVFLQGDKLVKLDTKTGNVEQLGLLVLDDPLHISFSNDEVFVANENEYCVYNIQESDQLVLKKKLDEHHRFLVSGKQNNRRLLMLDDYDFIHEQDLLDLGNPAEEDVKAKYSLNQDERRAILRTADKERLIFLHKNNSFYVTSSDSTLISSFSPQDRNIKNGVSAYLSKHDCLVSVFISYESYYIQRHYLADNRQEEIFFSANQEDPVHSIETNEEEDKLFVIFGSKVSVLHLEDENLGIWDIHRCDGDEKIYDISVGDDDGETVTVAVSQWEHSLEPCVLRYVHLGEGEYQLQSWHVIPTVTDEVIGNFASLVDLDDDYHDSIDIIESEEDVFVSYGMFLSDVTSEGDPIEISVEVHDVCSNSVQSQILNLNKAMYLRSSTTTKQLSMTSSQYRTQDISILGMSWNEETLFCSGEASSLVVYQLNKGQGYDEIRRIPREVHDTSIDVMAGCTVYEDYIYFWTTNELYHRLDISTGEIKHQRTYLPNIIVNGCDFTGSKMDEDVKVLIMEHGGLVSI